MSTIDSFSFISAETIKNNFLSKKMNYKYAIQLGLIITAIISYIIVINFTYVIEIWYLSGTIGASVLLVPFLNSIFLKRKSKYPILLMILPLIICLYWIILRNPLGLDAIYPGIISSSIIYYSTLDNE